MKRDKKMTSVNAYVDEMDMLKTLKISNAKAFEEGVRACVLKYNNLEYLQALKTLLEIEYEDINKKLEHINKKIDGLTCKGGNISDEMMVIVRDFVRCSNGILYHKTTTTFKHLSAISGIPIEKVKEFYDTYRGTYTEPTEEEIAEFIKGCRC